MLRAIGVPSLDALIDQTIPPGIRLHEAARPAAGRHRARLPAPAARRSPRRTSRCALVHRDGLLRLRHAERHPAQRVREPGLVHAVHAVSGRDRAGPARVAAELPDDGDGPDRDGDRDRVAARRGDGGGRSDDDVPPACRRRRRRRAQASVFLVSRSLLSADARRAARPRRAARHPSSRSATRDALPIDARRSALLLQYPDDRGDVARPAAVHRQGARGRACSSRSRPICSR